MEGYSRAQRRTFGRIEKYLESKGITDRSWVDFPINEDGTFIEWPKWLPQDEGPEDVEAVEPDDDKAEVLSQVGGLKTALNRDKTSSDVLLRCLLEELPVGRRNAVLRKAAEALKNNHNSKQSRVRNNATN